MNEVTAGQPGDHAARVPVLHLTTDVLNLLALFEERCREAYGQRQAPLVNRAIMSLVIVRILHVF